jgi:hypothetical protein
MSTKNDYTPEEWKSINAAPFLAGLFITMADPSFVVGITKEAMAVGKAISESGTASQAEVIRSLVESMKAGGVGARPELPDIPRRDLNAARSAMAEHLQKASAAIAARSPAEAQAYKEWLMAAAKRVAEAAREGGFLGFGGTLVSEREQEALEELAGKLGVPATT